MFLLSNTTPLECYLFALSFGNLFTKVTKALKNCEDQVKLLFVVSAHLGLILFHWKTTHKFLVVVVQIKTNRYTLSIFASFFMHHTFEKEIFFFFFFLRRKS